MPLLIGVLGGLLRSVGGLLKKSFLQPPASNTLQPMVTGPATPESVVVPKSLRHRLGTMAIANKYRCMANSQRIEDTASKAYRAIKQHNFDKIRQDDAMASATLNGFRHKAGMSLAANQPASPAFGSAGDDAMELRVESPTNHYHYYPQQPSRPGIGPLGKLLIGLAVAAGLATGIFGFGIWRDLTKFVNKPPAPVNVEVPQQPSEPQNSYGMGFGTPQTTTPSQ